MEMSRIDYGDIYKMRPRDCEVSGYSLERLLRALLLVLSVLPSATVGGSPMIAF